jgi:hypothetical protein
MDNTAHIDGNGNIVVQGVDGATITINPDNSTALRQLIMDFGAKLTDLPTEILTMIEKRQDLNSEIKTGANLYLTVLAELYELPGCRKLEFGLTVTNLTKENRYFNQPFFKVYPKFKIREGVEHDTFVMLPKQPNSFPKKLEYGEPLSVSYEIKDGAYDMYQKLLDKNGEAYIQAFVNTTVGELYESNKFTMKKLFENLNWLKQ